MKLLKPVLGIALLALLITSCDQDSPDELVPDTSNIELLALKKQFPLKTNDITKNGIYHGVVASSESLSRGKIWINLANNGNYLALIELVGQSPLEFKLKPAFLARAASATVFEFSGQAGSFTIDVTNFMEPVVSNLEIYNESFVAMVVKSMSNSMASSATATFSETGNPSFSGSWLLLADGSMPNPNGNGGDGITSLLITINGDDVDDFSFDSFNADTCLGNPNYYPTLNSYGVADFIVCDYQTTSFAGGTAKWNLSFDMTVEGYVNYFLCETTTAGSFTWTSNDGTIYKVGEIVID